MLKPFICGSGGFRKEEEDEESCTTPKRSPRKNSFCRRKNINPYSSRGLDKFSALLADLEEKRQTIYSQLGPQETPLIRFMFKDSNDCVPIVVRLKDNKTQHILNKEPTPEQQEPTSEQHPKRVQSRSFSWNEELQRPSYYLAAAVILILVLLAVFGRSVAVLCTSVGWYLLPSLTDKSNAKRSMKKKGLETRRSENKMVVKSAGSSPTGAVNSGHRKSF